MATRRAFPSLALAAAPAAEARDVIPPNGAYASATHDASGQFSASLPGYRLDSDTSP